MFNAASIDAENRARRRWIRRRRETARGKKRGKMRGEHGRIGGWSGADLRVSSWARSSERGVSIVEMSWTATGGRKKKQWRRHGEQSDNPSSCSRYHAPPEVERRSCLQARRTGSMAVKAHAGSWQLRRAKFSAVTNCFPACRRRWTRAVRFRPHSRSRLSRVAERQWRTV